MRRLILYGTSACHLCDLAEEMLLQLRDSGVNLEYDKLDIADSDALFERYGTVIPVLARGDGRELGWPFSAAELQEFISS